MIDFDLHSDSSSLEYIYKLDSFHIKCIQARVINASFAKHHRLFVPGDYKMTPEEEKFRDWYNGEKPLVAKMTDLELQVHVDSLQLIAYEARAKLAASKDEQRERKARGSKAKGFTTTLEPDSIATDAINNINRRTEKLSKEQKMLQSLMNLGMTEKEAREQMSAKALLDRMKLKQPNVPVSSSEVKESKPFEFKNPFGKPETTVSIDKETDVVTVTEIKPEEKPKFSFVNPFDKK